MKKLLKFLLIAVTGVILSFGTAWVLSTLVGSQPLVHDEAVYLSKSRNILEGTPSDEYRDYRPVGMVGYGWAMLHFGNDENWVRLIGVFFGSFTILSVYLLFVFISNYLIAVTISLLTLASPLFLQQSPQFLNDVPASGFLFLTLALVVLYYKYGYKRGWLYCASFVAALAFYTRYGSLVSILLIGLFTLMFNGVLGNRRDETHYQNLIFSALLFITLLLPHLIQSYISHGGVLEIIMRSGQVAGRDFIGSGLVEYIKMLPGRLAGYSMDISFIIGIFFTVVFTCIHKLRQQYPYLIWLGWLSIFSLLFTGAMVHAEPRYILFPIIVLAGVAISSVVFCVSKVSQLLSCFLVISLLCVFGYFGYLDYVKVNKFIDGREENLARNSYVDAAKVIEFESGESGCALWATGFRPEFSWYARCNTFAINDISSFQKDYLKSLEKVHFSAVFTGLSANQITMSEASRYGINLVEIYHSKKLTPSLGEMIIYKIVLTQEEEEFIRKSDHREKGI